MGYIWRGEADGLKGALSRREVSVNDTSGDTGSSPLWLAVFRNRLDMLRILLADGGDSFLENDYGIPPIQEALVRMVNPATTTPERKELEELLPWSEYFDRYDIPFLHRIAIGVYPISIGQALLDIEIARKIDFLNYASLGASLGRCVW